MIEAVMRWWCATFHHRISFAGGKEYRCRRCKRSYATPWASPIIR